MLALLELEVEQELLSDTERLSGEGEESKLGLTVMQGGVSKVAGVSCLAPSFSSPTCLSLQGTATAAGGTWAGRRGGPSESRR